jgi:hypothetical protein
LVSFPWLDFTPLLGSDENHKIHGRVKNFIQEELQMLPELQQHPIVLQLMRFPPEVGFNYAVSKPLWFHPRNKFLLLVPWNLNDRLKIYEMNSR